MPTSSCPSGRLEPPAATRGQGKEMRRAACTPRASKARSHTAKRCRCRPSGPGATLCVHPGSGCLAARVTWAKGGVEVGGAQVLAGRHGDDHLPHGMPRTGAGLAVAPCSASRAPRGLTTLTAGLARGPSTTGAAGHLRLLGRLHTGPGRESAPGVVSNVRQPGVKRDLQTGRSVQGTNGGRGSKDGAMQR